MSTSAIEQVETVHDVIAPLRELAKAFADALRAEAQLELDRPAFKQAAILRLMQTENPLTSTPEKPKLHSASSAEAVVETDPAYYDYRESQHEATTVTVLARAEYDAGIFIVKLTLQKAEAL